MAQSFRCTRETPGQESLQRYCSCLRSSKSTGVSHIGLDIILQEAGVPHVNQTAYRRHVGYADAIFATQETIAKHVQEGSTVYMCLNDLQKAFDSGEFPVLLDRLFSNRKTWKNWYEGGSCCVKLGDEL